MFSSASATVPAATHLADTNSASSPGGSEAIVVDDFSDVADWTAHPADGVELTLGSDDVKEDPALRLDFHFQGGGYAIARRDLELPLPENYAFTFRVRGDCPSNHLEFKLVDGSGENVWWHVERDVEFPAEYETFRIPKRKVQFAWGPRGGGEIDSVRAIEFAITAGSGGTGTVWIDDLTLVPLPPPNTAPLEPAAQASSGTETARLALDRDPETSWTSSDPTSWFLLDLGRIYEFSGLIVDWGRRYPADYRVEISDDGDVWSEAAAVRGSNGGRDRVFLPDTEARFVRISASADSARGATVPGAIGRDVTMEIREVEIVPLDRFADRESFFHEIARESRRGLYPRGIFGEQAYWTVIGLDHDDHEVLVGEEGAVELWAGGPSVEPFLGFGGQLLSWADARLETSLEDGYLPIPTVRWALPGLSLAITALAAGTSEAAEVFVRFRVENLGTEQREGDLFLAIRPFQVNPPSQTLNVRGGTTRLVALSVSPDGAIVDGRIPLRVSPAADRFGATSFAGGDVVADYLDAGQIPEMPQVEDPFGAASGAFAFPLSLRPGESREVVVRFPLDEGTGDDGTEGGAAAFAATLSDVARRWHETLDRVQFDLPPAADRYLETMRAQLGFILVNRSGPAIQPGVRSYARSWIRDGALTSAALLRCGHADAAREFLEWFAPHQYENGKIPCVVDRRGADPVPEHDSSGEFLFLVAEVYRFTGDRELAERHWPGVLAAARYLDSLRRERLGPEYQTPEMRAFYGILPPSISHEGYSAKPMHSYWDDFFALRGFKDAAFLARELGKPETAELEALTAEFSRDLGASIQAAQELHGISWVPGCADLGDFDATSTTIALTPVGVDGVVPREDLEDTFERYHTFTEERARTKDWDAYTPYELRNVGAFVRLGWPDRAHDLLGFFFHDQRPAGWRSWAEVVSREERTPRFLGDIPHTWVGSDYIRSFLDMFVAADPDGRFATIGAGVPWSWYEGSGVAIEGLPTPFGEIDLRMRSVGEESWEVSIGGNATTPPEGWIVRAPRPATTVRVDGEDVECATEIRVDHTPAEIVFGY